MAKSTDGPLASLEPLPQNDYFLAFGPHQRFFFGTPNGYAANRLPEEIVERITSGTVKRVLFASFGSHDHVWFAAYETVEGGSFYDVGEAAPPVLATLAARMSPSDRKINASFLRIQFGFGNAYIAWTSMVWRAYGLQPPIQRYLKDISQKNYYSPAKGLFNSNAPVNITHHPNGCFMAMGFERQLGVRNQESMYYVYNFDCHPLQLAFQHLRFSFDLDGIVYASIDPFSEDAENFVFIKAQKAGAEADFVLRLNSQDLISRISEPESRVEPGPASTTFRWAVALRSGRPNPKDTWELPLKKGKMYKVMEERGRDWFIACNSAGESGYVHKAWIDFNIRRCVNPTVAFAQFQEEVAKLFTPGLARSFPDIAELIVTACKLEDCNRYKKEESGLGICVHELESLFRASDAYSYAFLKEQRNKWHPDRFARFCHPDHREELKKKAEGMFVLITMLMEVLDKEEE